MIASLTKRLFEKLSRRSYREAYVGEHVRTGVAYQVRAMREQRGWNQKTFSEKMGKPQSVVSRLEDPNYGRLSVKTVLEIAATFDVAVLIQFMSFPDFLRRTRDVSPEALRVESFDERQIRTTDYVAPAPSVADVIVARYGGQSAPITKGQPSNAVQITGALN